MSHYKSPDGKVHYLDSKDFIHLLPVGSIEMNDVETEIALMPSILELRAKQILVVNEAYNKALSLPIDYLGTSFQADRNSQTAITNALSSTSLPTDFVWYNLNNDPVPITLIQLQELNTLIFSRNQSYTVQYQARKAAIRSATTSDEIKAIVW